MPSLPALPGRARSSFAFLIGEIRRHPAPHLCVLAAVSAASLLGIAGQYQMKLVIDAMTGGDRGAAIWPPFLMLMLALGLENLCWRASGYGGLSAFTGLAGEIRLGLFRHLLGHSSGYFARHFSGALANKLAMTAPAAVALQGELTWTILPALVSFAASLALLGAIDLGMAAVTALAVVLCVAGLAWLGARGTPRHVAHSDRASTVTGGIVDVLGNQAIVRAHDAAALETGLLAAEIDSEVRAHRRSWAYTEHMRVLHDLLVFLLTGGVLAYALHLWQQGQASAGDLVLVSTVTLTIISRSRDVALVLVEMIQHLGRIADATRTILVPHEIADAPGAAPLARARGALGFESVRFRHPGRGLLFDGLSLEIPAGQTVGLVGRSGAGKTTLLALLQRLAEIEAGRILIDGADIADLQLASLRRLIAVVPQDISLFHRSLADNIRYGRPEASDAEVGAAARAAHAHDFITELPQGYATLAGERGVVLSGGQRQRIAIARAFLKNAPILLLDEATSALDSESEQLVQAALDNLVAGRTVLAVAHRLSSIAQFDRLLVMEQGRIIEDGSHRALLRAGGLYARLWRAQSEQEEEVSPAVAALTS